MSIGRATSAAAPPAEPEAGTLNAPLFRSLLEGLDETRRVVVLDLGAVHSSTVELFGRFRCRLDIADLAQDIDSLNGSMERDERERIAEALLPARHREPADLVLCWDLLNYLERPALAALMRRIAMRSRIGTLAHGLIVYSDARMPGRPGRYAPGPGGALTDLAPAPPERPAPRYSPEDLSLCMPDYRIERGRLLRNGMQEFLFRL